MRSMMSGSFDGGLSTMLQPAAIAGATLCAARLSGKLNGLMPATGPIGIAAHDPVAPAVGRRPVERKPLPVDAKRLLGCGAEGERAAHDLAASVLDRLAGLAAQERGELVGVALDAGRHVRQRIATLVAREASGLPQSHRPRRRSHARARPGRPGRWSPPARRWLDRAPRAASRPRRTRRQGRSGRVGARTSVVMAPHSTSAPGAARTRTCYY